jgi:tight adherence protein C
VSSQLTVTMLSVPLGAAWGALVSVPIVRRARRYGVHARLDLGNTSTAVRRRAPIGTISAAVARLGPVARVAAGLRDRYLTRRAQAALSRELPVTIDLLAVAVAAGCTPYLAVGVAARWSPPLLAERLDRVRRACDLGSGLGQALDAVATETPRLRPLCDALLTSDRFGAAVRQSLARLATEERAALRRRAEARARTVPVRLLFPLVFLVLPAFGLLTVAPALLTGFART